jgi:LmbE family N-acetylglucosaminyl deacetylase
MNIQPVPEHLFKPETRHLLSIAHQDDEINYIGLIGRWGADADFLWMTNGDGLAPMENMDPLEYAELRKAETDAVLRTIGRPLERRTCLDYSEIEIYSNFVELTLAPANKPDVMAYMYRIGCDVYRHIKGLAPDVVWVPQFQNGHPEHDLMHILTAYSVQQVRRETGKKIELYQLPEYEYTIFIPLRFHPQYKGIVHVIQLSPEELAQKRRAIECYPSQVKLFEQFEKVINRIGFFGKLVGKGFDAEGFLSHEYFGPVPEDIDYTRSFHHFEWANYMFDKHKDIKVRFDKHLAVIARELKEQPFV